MTDELTDTELDIILARDAARVRGLYGVTSVIPSLVAALREAREALETLTRCIHEAHADGETFPVRVSVACHAADELLARAALSTEQA